MRRDRFTRRADTGLGYLLAAVIAVGCAYLLAAWLDCGLTHPQAWCSAAPWLASTSANGKATWWRTLYRRLCTALRRRWLQRRITRAKRASMRYKHLQLWAAHRRVSCDDTMCRAARDLHHLGRPQ
jgi:hypothetical protein